MQAEISDKVQQEFPDAEVQVVLDGNRAEITVVSNVFSAMSRVKKQQAVYASIADYIADGRLHAVTINALTPNG